MTEQHGQPPVQWPPPEENGHQPPTVEPAPLDPGIDPAFPEPAADPVAHVRAWVAYWGRLADQRATTGAHHRDKARLFLASADAWDEEAVAARAQQARALALAELLQAHPIESFMDGAPPHPGAPPGEPTGGAGASPPERDAGDPSPGSPGPSCGRCGAFMSQSARFCPNCVDRCHEATEFDHECAVCRPEAPPTKPFATVQEDAEDGRDA